MTRTTPTSAPSAQGLLPHKQASTQDPQDSCSPSSTPATLAAREKHPSKENPSNPRQYARPFCRFLTENPTVFHAVAALEKEFSDAGFEKLSERQDWELKKGGKYYVTRNGSSLVAFAVGKDYDAMHGNGVAMIAGHVDAITAKLKPIPKLENKAGYVQLGVAPYAGGLSETWWDRDLGIAGRVIVQDKDGNIAVRLVNLNEPIARIPTLAPHFGAAAVGPFNKETQMVPIIGLDNSHTPVAQWKDAQKPGLMAGVGTFTSNQPPRLVKAVCQSLDIEETQIVNWELEMYDVQPAKLGGLDKEFIYGGRIDDKLCSWAACKALIASTASSPDAEAAASAHDGIIKCVALFDDEEIGSNLRQGAQGNFLPTVISRAVESLSDLFLPFGILAEVYANSFLISADVTHAVNPNFEEAYLKQHAPRLNVGIAIAADPNGNMTTDAVSTAILQKVAEKSDSKLQIFQIRNDSRSGGTVGPMLSSKMGVRAIDAGLPQLSMHSIRAATGALDPGLGIKLFRGFFDFYEEIDAKFRET